MLGYVENDFDVFKNKTTNFANSIQRKWKTFEEVGSEIQYRCVKCRLCKDCKDHDHNEALSIREEIEQDVINRSVKVNSEKRTTSAVIPFMNDPVAKLGPSRDIALKVCKQQRKKVNKIIQDKNSVIKAEKKLHNLGYVDYVKNLPEDLQEFLESTPIQNFLPWRVAWKSSSIYTPCRPVFDASMPTESGISLIDIVAKRRNNMNKMVEIYIRWRSHIVAYHNDIQTMYNQVMLESYYWSLQRYWWEENLDPEKEPLEKVIKTLLWCQVIWKSHRACITINCQDVEREVS